MKRIVCHAMGVIALAISLSVAAAPLPLPPVADSTAASDGYAMADFARVRKYDAHVHANTPDPAFLEQARADGFELLSINVDYPDFPSVAKQHAAALALAARQRDRKSVV